MKTVFTACMLTVALCVSGVVATVPAHAANGQHRDSQGMRTTMMPEKSQAAGHRMKRGKRARARHVRPAAVMPPAGMRLPVGAALAASLSPVPVSRVILPDTGGQSGVVRTPEQFGARGDGIADDQHAIVAAFAALSPGDVLMFSHGRTYNHSGVLTIDTPRVLLTGGGVLAATNERASSVMVAADQVTVANMTVRGAETTRRWDAYEQMGLRLGPFRGITIANVSVDGAGAAGVYVGGAQQFTISGTVVRGSRADGFHVTEGSRGGVIVDCTADDVGDDGFAVVSYVGQPVSEQIAFVRPRMLGQRWGRGLSVVGGDHVTFTDVYVRNSNGAAVYLASEAEYNTAATTNVHVVGGLVENANTNAAVDHGAIMLYNSQPGTINHDLSVDGVRVVNTRVGWAQIQMRAAGAGARHTRVAFTRLAFTGGPPLFPYGVPANGYNRNGWTVNGLAIPDSTAWN